MRVWLMHIGEQLVTDENARPLRYGLLAAALVRQGHEVVHWSPTFSHLRRVQRSAEDTTISVSSRWTMELIYASGYQHNVGLKRLMFHRRLVKPWFRRAMCVPVPDIIVSSIPSLEWCAAALQYGRTHAVPVVVDIRDLWPDIFLSAFPRRLRFLGHPLLLHYFNLVREVCSQADALVGVSDTYLRWGLRYAGRGRTDLDTIVPLGYERVTGQDKDLTEVLARPLNSEEPVVCCFFGQFGRSYDLITVVDAARILHDRGRLNLHFVLCGDGERMQDIRARSAGLSNVSLPGWINASEIAAIMEKASIGLAAYSREAPQSLPNKPIEYFAGGLAVVSSLRGELANILDEHQCGLTYPAGNARALADALDGLAQSPATLADMKRRAAGLFDERFEASRVYGAFVEHLEGLIHKDARTT